jgi:hypothetical protein
MSLSDFTQGMLVGIAITLGSLTVLMIVLALKQVAKKDREG